MNTLMKFQSNLFILMSGFTLFIGYGLDLNSNLFILFITLGFVVVLGVPHGSLDVLFASQTFDLKHLTHWVKFIIYYVIAALGVILVWLIAPNIFFISFLILSALHFSDDLNLMDFEVLKFSYGAAIITFPSLFFSAELINLYAMIVDIETAPSLVKAIQFVSIPAGIILATQLLNKIIEIRTKLEVLCVGAIFLLLNPILAFGVYFCVMHSARHLIRSHFFLHKFTMKVFLTVLILLTIAVVMMGLVVWWVGANTTLEVDMIRIIFIGLAALTVPHTWVLKKSNFQAWSITHKSGDYY